MGLVMLYRAAVAAAAFAVVGLPGLAIVAAGAPVADAEGVGNLAMDAAEVISEEQALLGYAVDSGGPQSNPDIDVRLRAADSRGVAVLAELQRQGVELSEGTVTVLSRLPRPGQGMPPGRATYDAAIAELSRIAATADSEATSGSERSGPALGLLAVAAMSLLVLGAAALGNTLRRRDSDEELAAMAWSDGLTGLANRRRFDHDLAMYDRGKFPVSSVMIDVDHFKNVNDTFGHERGDEVLRQVASVLGDHVRYDDVVYRYGGEEFCILLPGASRNDAIGVGQRIVEAARRITLPDGSHLTVSVGVAHDKGATASESFRSADQALLAAKDAGRDQAVDAASLEHVDEPVDSAGQRNDELDATLESI